MRHCSSSLIEKEAKKTEAAAKPLRKAQKTPNTLRYPAAAAVCLKVRAN